MPDAAAAKSPAVAPALAMLPKPPIQSQKSRDASVFRMALAPQPFARHAWVAKVPGCAQPFKRRGRASIRAVLNQVQDDAWGKVDGAGVSCPAPPRPRCPVSVVGGRGLSAKRHPAL